MPKRYVCECKSVSLSEILKSIRLSNLSTLLDIQNTTKAATGCGRCKIVVEDILNKELKERDKLGQQLKLDF